MRQSSSVHFVRVDDKATPLRLSLNKFKSVPRGENMCYKFLRKYL